MPIPRQKGSVSFTRNATVNPPSTFLTSVATRRLLPNHSLAGEIPSADTQSRFYPDKRFSLTKQANRADSSMVERALFTFAILGCLRRFWVWVNVKPAG
jgi:hypothetical protein